MSLEFDQLHTRKPYKQNGTVISTGKPACTTSHAKHGDWAWLTHHFPGLVPGTHIEQASIFQCDFAEPCTDNVYHYDCSTQLKRKAQRCSTSSRGYPLTN